MSRLVMRFEEGHAASTDLAFSGSVEGEENLRTYKTAIKKALRDLLRVVRYCYPGSRIKRLEAMVWDPSFRDKYRKEYVPTNLEKIQERLDAEDEPERPFLDELPEISAFVRAGERETSEDQKLSSEVAKIHTPEDFMKEEA